jgi:hypothetical protein
LREGCLLTIDCIVFCVYPTGYPKKQQKTIVILWLMINIGKVVFRDKIQKQDNRE